MHRVIRRRQNLKRHIRRSLASDLAATRILIYTVCILYSCSRLVTAVVLRMVNTERPQASKHTISSQSVLALYRRQTRLSSRSESSPQACPHVVLSSHHVAGYWKICQEPHGLLDPCRCMCQSRINRSRPALALFGHRLWAHVLIR
jgi:hypothetical protein